MAQDIYFGYGREEYERYVGELKDLRKERDVGSVVELRLTEKMIEKLSKIRSEEGENLIPSILEFDRKEREGRLEILIQLEDGSYVRYEDYIEGEDDESVN